MKDDFGAGMIEDERAFGVSILAKADPVSADASGCSAASEETGKLQRRGTSTPEVPRSFHSCRAAARILRLKDAGEPESPTCSGRLRHWEPMRTLEVGGERSARTLKAGSPKLPAFFRFRAATLR